MSDYTRELSKDILERLQTQRVVGNQTGASQADVSITEALTLLAEIERLHDEVKKAELAFGRGMSHAMVQFYKEELPKAKRLAWDECATKAHELRVRTETADKLLAANPYRKEETK